jgi:hypothetical protein
MLGAPYTRAPTLFWQKTSPELLFQGPVSVFHLLSLSVSQCFFPLNFDILPSEEQIPCCLDFVAFFIIFEFFCCWEFETNALFFLSFLTEQETLVKDIRSLRISSFGFC